MAQDVHDREVSYPLVASNFLELRRFRELETHIYAHHYQQGAGKKRDPPTPRHHLILGKTLDEQEGEGGKHEARRHAGLRETAIEGALLRRSMFDGHQHGPAPLSADREALHETGRDKQDGRGDADLVVGGDQPDHDGGGPHQNQ